MLKSVLSHHNRIDGSHSKSENPQSGLMIKNIENPKGPFLLLSFENHSRVLKNINRFCTDGRCFVPYAITDERKVIYSNYGEHLGFNHNVDGVRLKPYDCQTSLSRQQEYQSLLTSLILKDPSITKDAVDNVSGGVINFIKLIHIENGRDFSDFIKKTIGHYFWTNGRHSFGRISLDNVESIDSEDVLKTILQTLKAGTIEQKLAIHDAIGRKVLLSHECEQREKYLSLAETVRQDWFDDPQTRGRIRKKSPVLPCETIGLLPSDSHLNQPEKVQSRQRAIDIFIRDEKRMSHPQANDYYDDLDTRNLLFGAGISGTTGTLFQAAEAFGQLQTTELKKQYCAAILGYLVGGGMHSYHEVMAVAEKVGIPYKPGSFMESLPESIFNNDEFKNLSAQYYDVAVLGATHWRFNESCLPSHLNKSLTKS